MSPLSGRLPVIITALAVILIVLFYFAPNALMAFLTQVGNLWLITLFAGTAGVLSWFVYWVCLRRILRARKIARIRWRRLLTEAASRDADRSS